MSRATKTKIIVMTMLLVILAAVVSVAIVIENKSNVIAIGDDVVLDNGVHNMPKNLVFAMANTADAQFTEKSVKLTATVKPDHATNKILNWSVVWQNPNSEWASGKNINDYLTISNDKLNATLTCKMPFSEKAIIIAQAADNANAKATCVVDYLCDFKLKYEFFIEKNGVREKFTETLTDKVSNPDIGNGEILPHNPDIKLINFDFDEDEITEVNEGSIYYIKLTPEFTNGTMRPTVKLPLIAKISSLSDSFKKIASDKYNANIQPLETSINLTRDNDGYYRISNYTLMQYIAVSVISFDINNNLDIDAFFRESFKNCSMQLRFAEAGSYEYNGKNLGYFTPNICFGIDESTCKYFKVKTISFDKNNAFLGVI